MGAVTLISLVMTVVVVVAVARRWAVVAMKAVVVVAAVAVAVVVEMDTGQHTVATVSPSAPARPCRPSPSSPRPTLEVVVVVDPAFATGPVFLAVRLALLIETTTQAARRAGSAVIRATRRRSRLRPSTPRWLRLPSTLPSSESHSPSPLLDPVCAGHTWSPQTLTSIAPPAPPTPHTWPPLARRPRVVVSPRAASP